ncbi:MAG: CaiB/BaiF CoA transferase family protein [Alphaproteobacteria bacterium]
MTMARDTASLRGVRVVDFSWVMAGPMATKILGAMGAEVIKIESSTRPEFSERDGMFAIINNNKRSCTVDIASAQGQDLLRRVIAMSDVVVENFSSRVLRRHGLAYEDLRAVKPDLIFVSASGLGRSGPQADLLAYGSLLQGYSGRVGMIGTLNPFLEAMGILPAWTDPITALWEVLAIQAALRQRDRTGQGCHIDLSMLESTVALLPGALLRAALGVPEGEPGSTTEPEAAPSGCFRCAGADDWLAVSVRCDREWRGLCAAAGWQDLVDSPGHADRQRRLAAKPQLNERLAAWLRTCPGELAERLLRQHGVPAARSRHIGELVRDEHLLARGVFQTSEAGPHLATLPWRDEHGWRGDYAPAPAIGADNDYVFGELLGLTPAARAELSKAGVIR